MRPSLHRSRLSRWALLLVLLASALAPGVSRALASVQRLPWLQVCSVDGVASRGRQQVGAVHLAWDHCPYCSGVHEPPALLPPAAVGFRPSSMADVRAAPAWQPMRATAHWVAGQARAPPAMG